LEDESAAIEFNGLVITVLLTSTIGRSNQLLKALGCLCNRRFPDGE
jgi:hypothetical protein